MTPIGWAIAIIFLAGVAVAGCFAVANDEDAFTRVQLVSHEWDEGWDEGGDQEYDSNYGSRDDRNRNRDRNRGAFSPGPFDDSPVTITICAVPDSCPQNPPPEQGGPQ